MNESSQAQYDEFHKLTGEIIRLWAQLEHQLADIAAVLLKIDSYAASTIMTAVGSGKAQRKLVLSLAEAYLDEPMLPELQALINGIADHAALRNRLAHDMVGLSADRTLMSARNQIDKGALTTGWGDHTFGDLERMREDLKGASMNLVIFRRHAVGRVYVKPKVQREAEKARRDEKTPPGLPAEG
jgi:hypothetical protein